MSDYSKDKQSINQVIKARDNLERLKTKNKRLIYRLKHCICPYCGYGFKQKGQQMLNLECIDKTESGNVELCFTDSDGDDSVRIIITQKTAWDIAKEIQKKYCYATNKAE